MDDAGSGAVRHEAGRLPSSQMKPHLEQPPSAVPASISANSTAARRIRERPDDDCVFNGWVTVDAMGQSLVQRRASRERQNPP